MEKTMDKIVQVAKVTLGRTSGEFLDRMVADFNLTKEVSPTSTKPLFPLIATTIWAWPLPTL